MKLEEAKTLAESLLLKANVMAVYYVDDYLSFDGLKSITKFIEDNSADCITQHIDNIPEEIVMAKNADVDYVGKIHEWWSSLSSDSQEAILNNINADDTPHSEHYIRKLLNEKCIFCTPEEWEKKRSNECLAQVQSGQKVLLLFDLKLDDRITLVGEGRDGLKFAQSFSENEGVKENSYCGIFSQQFSIENEFDFRNKNSEILSSWAFPISKERVSNNDDYTLFIEGLNNLLWVGYVDNLSSIAQKLILDTSNKIRDQFKEILPQEFKQVVINSSAKEGCREIDTLIRLIHILFNKELQYSLANLEGGVETFNHEVTSIKEIDTVTKDVLAQHYDSKKVKSIFQDENFIPGEIINKLLTPLQNGDVFCVNNKIYYVLLCQPCNISLRSGGKRGNKYDLGYFVPLKKSNAEEKLIKELESLLEKDDEEKNTAKKIFLDNLHKKLHEASQGYLYRIKCAINEKSMCIAINDYKTISLSLLDYCTFSESGDVIINKDCSENLHDNQKQLYENHSNFFKESIDLNHLLADLSEETKVIVKPKVESWFYSFLTKLGIKPRFENSKYIFPIKRYGHIQDPLASDLLTQLSHYISRAGLPSEFERLN